ncbi:MAG: flagellar basal body P-ring formation chaperone FlgA [Acidiferrobacterales bacterium]
MALLLLGSACIAVQAQNSAGFHENLDSIRTAVRNFLTRQNASNTRRTNILVDRLDPRLQLAACGQPLRTSLPPGAEAIGNTTVGVRCTGNRPWSLYVPATVQVFDKVLIAARPLVRGARLAPTDFLVSDRDVSSLTTGFVSNPQQVKGEVLREPLTAGTVLLPGMMEGQRLVRRGMPVTIVAQAGGLKVRVQGRALGDGAAGQWVQVRNSMSNKVIEGIVTRNGSVRVPM